MNWMIELKSLLCFLQHHMLISHTTGCLKKVYQANQVELNSKQAGGESAHRLVLTSAVLKR